MSGRKRFGLPVLAGAVVAAMLLPSAGGAVGGRYAHRPWLRAICLHACLGLLAFRRQLHAPGDEAGGLTGALSPPAVRADRGGGGLMPSWFEWAMLAVAAWVVTSCVLGLLVARL